MVMEEADLVGWEQSSPSIVEIPNSELAYGYFNVQQRGSLSLVEQGFTSEEDTPRGFCLSGPSVQRADPCFRCCIILPSAENLEISITLWEFQASFLWIWECSDINNFRFGLLGDAGFWVNTC